MLSWAPLHDLTTSWFPRFFFFWCSVQKLGVLFILLLCDSFMIGLTSWPMCRGGQGKSNRGIHYPFEIITLSNKNSSLLLFLWVSLVGGHHYQIVFGSQGNYLLWVNYKCSDFVLFLKLTGNQYELCTKYCSRGSSMMHIQDR